MSKIKPKKWPIAHYIEETNLSTAWSRAFLALSSHSGHEIEPLLVSITGFDEGVARESKAVRDALDACLTANGYQSVHTVANTIFPQSIWRRAKGNRQKLFEEYIENLPTYVEMAPSKNKGGLYFSRLIAYAIDPKTGARLDSIPIGKLPGFGNQLEFILEKWKTISRKSLFQATIFDAARDHIGGAQQGFPCMQHLSFVPDRDSGTLAVNAFYATQQLFVKAYGNYLGLSRLGAFMAGECGLKLTKVSCFCGVEKMDQRPTANAHFNSLIAAAEVQLSGSEQNQSAAQDAKQS